MNVMLMRARRDRRGQAVPLMLIVVLMAMILMMATGSVGRLAIDASRARTAADSAALAGVDGGRAASERRAADHGAALVSFASYGPPDAIVVRVTVRYGRASATAAASNRGP